jgi:hypothetical protein
MNDSMKIDPFEEHKDTLFTDYVMQMFNAHISEDSHKMLEALINSYETEAVNKKSFFPGIIFGAMVHMMMLMQIISDQEDQELSETVSRYNELYNAHRNKLSNMLGNRPEYAEAMIKLFLDENGDFK